MRKNIDISNSDLPRRLQSLREEKRLTQADLAAAAEISYRTLHDLELGRKNSVQAKTLMLLSRALDVPYAELAGDGSGADPSGPAPGPRPRRARRAAVFAAAAALLAAAAAWALASLPVARMDWSAESSTLVARDGVVGIERWRRDLPERVCVCEESPWSRDVILAGLAGDTGEGGRLLALDRGSGETLWEVRPDLDALSRAFGEAVVNSGNFNCRRIVAPDLDGDGVGELVVHFEHSLWYPAALCCIDSLGRLESQYANCGHIYGLLPVDLDSDGKQELVAAGTNNARAYQGATVFVLDDRHRSGASIDAAAHPESSEPDSALARVVIPQYPRPIMDQMSTLRLAGSTIRSFESAAGDVELAVDIGTKYGFKVVVRFDGELHPLSAAISDEFLGRIDRTWPDSLQGENGPAGEIWREKWLTTARRFEAGHWPPRPEPEF